MPTPAGKQYAYNRTRQAYLATTLAVADTHWSRLRGLMAKEQKDFPEGSGLWIVPCRGVHTFLMRFPIDVVYLDAQQAVVHLEEHLRPWRLAPLRLSAASVVELPPGTIHDTRTGLGDIVDVGLTGREVKQ
ncbi:MAG: DUF192 domain-containing protein [Acidobacteria bacterium]|nr:DUF192 domain-containing protein [Acidobacteriota bacterium]MBV8891296.1 DUF192 domain-containing protein [Acidobacteriota bacterium]MBV9480159.1 DUF192 domain-containing protein [Acidobacteriota bacterium]